MRVLNSAKWVLSVAASSGMVLILSGSALAAESGPDMNSRPAQEDIATSSTKIQTTSSTADVHVTVQQDSRSTAEPSMAVPSETEAAAEVPAPTPTEAGTPTTRAVTAPTDMTQLPVSLSPAATAEIRTPAALAQASSTAERIPVVSWAKYLPAQTGAASSVAMPVMDVAPQMPTAMVPTNHNFPVPPAEPTGLLGHFAAQLAGSVVKPVFMPDMQLLGAGFLTLIIFLTLLSIGKFETILAGGSRREGFAHAPRSDVAVATFNFLFATPFSMSYVTAHRQDAAHF